MHRERLNNVAMAKYLDPRIDLTFKKVFGENEDLLMSLLNALLPLPEGDEIESIEYLPTELVPETPLKKDTIVDVRCRDNRGRQFIVEMQMIWTPAFMQRVLFNASKAYVRQSDKGGRYEDLQPVYSLNLVNDVFRPDMPDVHYHLYKMVHDADSKKVIEGLQLIFVELPKFKPTTLSEKRMYVLWLRFLTEINESTVTAPEELAEQPQISKAMSIVEKSAYTDEQLDGYDRYRDIIWRERTLVSDSHREGFAEGVEEGIQKGIQKERLRSEKALEEERLRSEKVMKEEKLAIARSLKQMGMADSDISKATGLSAEEIANL